MQYKSFDSFYQLISEQYSKSKSDKKLHANIPIGIIKLESWSRVVKAEDSQLSGCVFKSWRRILDGVSKTSYYIGKINKGSKMGNTKKKNLKK